MCKNVNTSLSLKGCWRMVNNIQCGKTPEEIRERAQIAEQWLVKNTVISIDDFDELMMAVSYLYRESYYLEHEA